MRETQLLTLIVSFSTFFYKIKEFLRITYFVKFLFLDHNRVFYGFYFRVSIDYKYRLGLCYTGDTAHQMSPFDHGRIEFTNSCKDN